MTALGAVPSPSADGPGRARHLYGGEVNTLVDIYGKHERRIYRYCLALLRNPDDAEDATQETFTRAAPFLPNLAGDLSAYLTTVARNICCDVVRARARRPVPLDKVSLPDRAVSPERQSVDWDVVRRMWRQLTPSERLLFAYTFAGYRYEEIASRTGMSRPSVSVGLTRARRRLRDLATAIGALGLLPLGLRRLLDRVTRRANAALASGQQVLLSVAEQAGAVAAGLLAGLVSLGAAGTAAVASPLMSATAFHAHDAPASQVAPAATVDNSAPVTTWTATRSGQPQLTASPSPVAAPVAPVIEQAAGVLPGGTATPNDTRAYTVTRSPGFSQDGIVFMTGTVHNGCAQGTCQAVFRSENAGASWRRLWLETYPGGSLLLPPTYPADPTIFVLFQGAGLLAGSPASNGPAPILPGVTAAAIAPESAPGKARIAAATTAGSLETFTVGDPAPLPGPALPAGVTGTGMVFAAPGVVVVSGIQQTVTGQSNGGQQAVLVTCRLAATCAAPAVLAEDSFVTLASTGAYGSPLLAYSSQRAFLSTDSGGSFRLLTVAGAGQVLEAAGLGATPTGTRLLASRSDLATQRRTTAAYSDDLGATWTDATGDLVSNGQALSADVLHDGTLLLGLLSGADDHFALLTSSGTGHWAAPTRPA